MKTYTLNEVSEILNIAKPTLRYWEKEGLIQSERNAQNEYREYTSDEIFNIGNIIFYRDLHLPIKTLKNLYDQSIEDKYKVMEASCQDIDHQIEELINTKQKIKQRIQSFHLWKELQGDHFENAVPNFSYISHLHMENPDTIKQYLDNQNSLAIVFDAQHLEVERYGLIQQTLQQGHTLLWEKKEDVSYLPCLVRVKQQKVFFEDINRTLLKIKDANKTVGTILGNYLITDKDVDYFQVWIEVL